MAGAIHSVAGAIHSVAGVIHSVAGVVCPVAGARPVAGAHYPVAGVTYTVVGDNHSVAAVTGELHCIAEVPPVSLIGALLDCPRAVTVADHSLTSGVMHCQVTIIKHIRTHTQAMACVLTIHAAVGRFQCYKCQ